MRRNYSLINFMGKPRWSGGEDEARESRLVCHIDMPCCYAIIVDMAAAHNFHVPLAESTYRELREIAEQLRRPATQLGREAIESWLKEARRASIAEAIQAYAEQAAGTTADLDEALENASIENMGSTDGGSPEEGSMEERED